MTNVPFNILREFKDQNGKSLYDISSEKKSLVVFLRHTGCIFCRETLSDISKSYKRGLFDEYNVVLVHMSQENDARQFFGKYGLGSVYRISDPDRILYGAFGLKKGNITQLFGPRNLIRGITAVLSGNFQGKVVGDGFQMPGIFVLHEGEIIGSFIHKRASDRPDYRCITDCGI